MKSGGPLLVALLLALTLAVAACGGSGTPGTGGNTSGGTSAGDRTVVEKDLAFDPASLEVKIGDTVTFTNEDSAPHNVSIDGTELGMQDKGASVTWTAEKAGTFPYFCTVHPSMKGEIVVK